ATPFSQSKIRLASRAILVLLSTRGGGFSVRLTWGGPLINTANATRQSVFFAVIFLFCAGLATGQIAGGLTETTNAGLGGNNFVVGTVFSPAGSPINTRIRIR